MRTSRFLLATVLVAFWATADTHAADRTKLEADVVAAIKAFQKADSGLKATFEQAAGYAVFPNVGKGGFVLGGAHGNGLVYEQGKLIGTASLTQVTVGAQVGGQEFAEVIFFEDTPTLERFKESKLGAFREAVCVRG